MAPSFFSLIAKGLRAYPESLGLEMVRKHLAFQPLWAFEARLKERDGLLWRQQALVEGAQNLLGVLAGVNHLYYSTFQFKRMGDFISQMEHKPRQLYERLTAMLSGSEAASVIFHELVEEVADLAERRMPDVDLTTVRRQLARVERSWQISA
ncbi:MAG TPA: hypothetical protein VG944_01825 [Fimbriimonas sp.]|nr:hypothetical protein [Fimbriimonas sp.]